MTRLSPLVVSALVAAQSLAPASAAPQLLGSGSVSAQAWLLARSDDNEQKDKDKKKKQQQREQERQRQEKETRDKYKQKYEQKYDQKYQDKREKDRRQEQKEKDMKQHYKNKYDQKYEDKYKGKYRRNMERSRYAPGYRPANRYAWSGWDRNRWGYYNRYPTWSPWVRPVAYGAYNPFPVWAQPGWYDARPWNTGWYGGWSAPPWGWWGGQSLAWGIAGLATTTLINGLIDKAVQQRQPVIVVPSSNWQLVYGTVQPEGIGQVTFVASNGSGSYRLSADCNEGLLDGQVPFQAAQAQLINAACQVAYGSYLQAGYSNPGYGNPGYGNPGYGNPGYGNPGYGNPGYGRPSGGGMVY
ncbi:MAG: hypothetical protein VKO00_02220 [Cyanobacteriota bacterium]|nr:hypothetical protein [Cyanobacteriota bacterium]